MSPQRWCSYIVPTSTGKQTRVLGSHLYWHFTRREETDKSQINNNFSEAARKTGCTEGGGALVPPSPEQRSSGAPRCSQTGDTVRGEDKHRQTKVKGKETRRNVCSHLLWRSEVSSFVWHRVWPRTRTGILISQPPRSVAGSGQLKTPRPLAEVGHVVEVFEVVLLPAGESPALARRRQSRILSRELLVKITDVFLSSDSRDKRWRDFPLEKGVPVHPLKEIQI